MEERNIKNKKYEFDIQEEVLECLKDSKYSQAVTIKLEKYITEYFHQKNYNELDVLSKTFKVKENRENYQPLSSAFAFQFYDLIKVIINGEVIAGKIKYNVSPIIYIGERNFFKDSAKSPNEVSVIIDKDGFLHSGEQGLLHKEYLDILKNSSKEEQKDLDRKKVKVFNK